MTARGDRPTFSFSKYDNLPSSRLAINDSYQGPSFRLSATFSYEIASDGLDLLLSFASVCL